ncbi:MAG TPA: hypothetical protein VN364_08090 [Bellilinea sp.]|nr:hypothetical protein [Bellilinea sp.]
MAYSVVPTVATGDLWTAANHNTYIRDNFLAGVPGIFTTAGDQAYASAPGAASRLPIGAVGKALRVSSGNLPAWEEISLKTAQIKRTTNQNIPNGTDTVVTFTTEVIDTNGMVDLGTYNTRITVPASGIYLVFGQANFASYAGTKHVKIKKNGGSTEDRTEIYPSNGVALNSIGLYQCIANDYFELMVHQGSGGDLNVFYASLNVIKVG